MDPGMLVPSHSVSMACSGAKGLGAHSSVTPLSIPTPQIQALQIPGVKISPCLNQTLKSQQGQTSQIGGWELGPISGHGEGCESFLAQPSLCEWSMRTTRRFSEHHPSEAGCCFHHVVSFTKMTPL